jgi:hypothetical protein
LFGSKVKIYAAVAKTKSINGNNTISAQSLSTTRRMTISGLP